VIHNDLLVGPETRDDAAVYRVAPELALVLTADFITPIVDDPVAFGAVAAANALSDVYAMGAEPIVCLNLVGFPRDALPLSVLSEILSASAAVVHEAGALTVGGHTIDDPELKFGLSVVGRVHPDRVVRNSDGRAGDTLYLTKPLGVGVFSTALKQEAAPDELTERAVGQMRTTNRAAARAMLTAGVNAATDVSGFGLLGHLNELALASGLAARLDATRVPILEGVRELAVAGRVPGGTRRNLAAAEQYTNFPGSMTEADRVLLADAQTSGGLLIAVPAERATALESALREEGVEAAAIGELTPGQPGAIRVL
jgi:selenide,water dikinase